MVEYLKSIRSINNNIDTNTTSLLLYTNKRTIPIDLEFTTKQGKECISYKYKDNIKNICNKLNIDTYNYYNI